MKGYLGEFPVLDLRGTPYENYGPTQFALDYIARYGGIDGDHHKAWVLDQVARILNGAPVFVMVARWDDGTEEFRTRVGTSPAYETYVRDICGDGEYEYDAGIAP